MSDNEELRELFGNIKSALKRVSVPELSNAVAKSTGRKDDNLRSEIDFILTLVCKEFKISKNILLRTSRKRELVEPKKTAYCLLSINLKLPVRYIAKNVFENVNHDSVHRAKTYFVSLNEAVKPDKIFKERYDRLSKILTEKITTK